MNKKLSYQQFVDYSKADPMKVLAQKQGLATKQNMPRGFEELKGTRGESAYVFSLGALWGALVQEGLGTKSLIAQSVFEATKENRFAAIAQDSVACIINDLISVGALPVVLNAYWTSSSYAWLENRELAEDFIKGWRAACDLSEVVWGGGETQSLPGIVEDGRLEFAGSAFGIIQSKSRLIQGKNLRDGDAIVLIESSGVHANGISLARGVAAKLKDGYDAKLPGGLRFGEALLTPSIIYAQLIRTLFQENVPIHYLSNITGHGWRKLMRAEPAFTYVLDELPPVPEVFDFIAEFSESNAEDMYGIFNMGAGYAIYVPEEYASKVAQVATQCGLRSWRCGTVETGPKRVIISQENIIFDAKSLEVR